MTDKVTNNTAGIKNRTGLKERISALAVYAVVICVMTAVFCHSIGKTEKYDYQDNYWGMSATDTVDLKDGTVLTEVLPAACFSFDGITLRDFNSNGSYSGNEKLHVVLSDDATGEVFDNCVYPLRNHQFDDATVFIPCKFANDKPVALQIDVYTEGLTDKFVTVSLSDSSAVGGAFFINDVAQPAQHFCMNSVVITPVQDNAACIVYYVAGILAASALLVLCLTGKIRLASGNNRGDTESATDRKIAARKRFPLYLTVFIVMNLVFLLFYYVVLKSIQPDGSSLRKYYVIIGLIAVAGANITLALVAWGRAKITTVYIVSALILGTAFCFLIPSYCVQDERFHFDQAYIMSNEWMGIDDTGYPDRIYKRSCDIDGSIPATMEITELEYSVICGRLFDKVDGDDTELQPAYAVTDGVRTAPEVSYLPQAIGITVARVMNFNMITMTFFARMANLVAITLLMALALRRMPFGKSALAVTMLLPMTLLLSASASYDGFILASAFLFTAYCLDAVYHPESISALNLGVLIVSALLLAMSKGGVYIPMLCLVFMLLKNPVRDSKSALLRRVAIAVFALAVVGAAAIKLYPTVKETLDATGFNNENIYEARTLYNVPYALDNIGRVVRLVFWSLARKSYSYCRGMLGTQLGLSVRLPVMLSAVYLFLLVISSFKHKAQELSLTVSRKILAAVIAVVCILLIMVSMLFAVTDITDKTIRGVQGRYFLPFLPLVLLLFRNRKTVTTGISEGDMILAVTIVNSIAIGLAMSVIVVIEAF